jgi:ergothioneine biosynthesis protein EgtB
VAFPAFQRTRALTEALAALLSPEDATVQSMPDASPAKWHLGHTTWFFETFLLEPFQPGYRPFHPSFPFLFNSYYETLGPRLARGQRGLLTRPSLGEVLAYRRAVNEAMGEAWPLLPGVLAELGLGHEEQHQELLLTDLLHLLSLNPLRPAYASLARPGGAPPGPLAWVAHPGGTVAIGHEGPGFAFDHEGPRHLCHLRPFRVADRCSTNGEYLEFILDGGYRDPRWWLAEGWAAVTLEGWRAPLYWEGDGTDWKVFTLAGLQDLSTGDPVCHVSYFEADAFARWAGARLPTESEWEAAAQGSSPAGGGLDPMVLRPRPAGPGTSLRQLFGEVWQWTASPYLAYPGFRPAQGALGEYNGKFMINQMVLRGGSCFTPRGHTRPTYRNFFPPQARWQAAGIRLAEVS